MIQIDRMSFIRGMETALMIVRSEKPSYRVSSSRLRDNVIAKLCQRMSEPTPREESGLLCATCRKSIDWPNAACADTHGQETA